MIKLSLAYAKYSFGEHALKKMSLDCFPTLNNFLDEPESAE
jgi:hypothetical protein